MSLRFSLLPSPPFHGLLAEIYGPLVHRLNYDLLGEIYGLFVLRRHLSLIRGAAGLQVQVQYGPLVIGIQLSWAVFQKLASTIGLQAKSEILEDLVQVS